MFPPSSAELHRAEWAAELGLRSGRSLRAQLVGLVLGDARQFLLSPLVPELRSGAARTITQAWLTIKKTETDLDAAAVLQVIITTNVTSVGVVLNGIRALLCFDLSASQTGLLSPHRTYFAEVQFLLSDGSLHTMERTSFSAWQQITTGVSPATGRSGQPMGLLLALTYAN